MSTATVNPNSIRQICLRGFLAGVPRKDIAAEIQAKHPNTQAAKLSTKHIAWHYGDMKKRGLLTDAPAPAKPTEIVIGAMFNVLAESDTAADDAELERLLIEETAAQMAARIDAELDAETE